MTTTSSISVNHGAIVVSGAQSISLSSLFSTAASPANPTYLVLTGLDRNEYTASSTGATGTLTGNGAVARFGSIGADGRGIDVIFTYQASTGRYFSSTYGYFDQVTYISSASTNDLTNFSLFGTNNLALANSYGNNAYAMAQLDPGGYLGSVTIATQPSYHATVPTQATPDSIAAAAQSFVGRAWNMNGCWVLASTIAAEAGAALPVQSTMIGVPGQANGEWYVAFNGPAGQSGNWQSLVSAGDIVVIGTATSGHITTCVSGSGSSAMLIDNITYVNGSNQILNAANDGSSADIIIAAPHLASQEWNGVLSRNVVIYALDTPVVTPKVSTFSLAANATLALSNLFSASDPVAGHSVVSYQIYDTAASTKFVVSGTTVDPTSAATAATVSSLDSCSLLAGTAACLDTIQVRAYNGAYWGDWRSLAVSVTASAPASYKLTPASSTVNEGAHDRITLATTNVAAGTTVGYTISGIDASRVMGGSLSGTAIVAANGSATIDLGIVANSHTDGATTATLKLSNGLASASITVNDTSLTPVNHAPVVANQTAAQNWLPGVAASLTLAANTFTDQDAGQTLTYKAALSTGAALPSWLTFNAASAKFSGVAPLGTADLSIKVTATDPLGLSASETISFHVYKPPTLNVLTPTENLAAGKSFNITLPSTTFVDPNGKTMTFTASELTATGGQSVASWLHFDAAHCAFFGTAPLANEKITVSLTATDSLGLSASETINFNVGNVAALVGVQPAHVEALHM